MPVWELTQGGHQIKPTLALIAKLAPDQQASILAAPNAMRGLVNNGEAEAIDIALFRNAPDRQDAQNAMALINGLAPDQAGRHPRHDQRGVWVGRKRPGRADRCAHCRARARPAGRYPRRALSCAGG